MYGGRVNATRRALRPLTRAAPLLAVAWLMAACGAAPAGDSGAPSTSLPPTAPTTSTPPPTLTSTAAPTTTSLPPETTTTEERAVMRLTIVYDNYAHDPRLTDGWGFAVLIEVSGRRILFDTGGDGAALLGNLTLLGIAPSTLDAVVLSHEHQDHVGGLSALLDAGLTAPVYLPASFSPTFKTAVATRTRVVEVAGPRQIRPGVFSTGQMGGPIVEQALALDTPQGVVVITGCAHPGIVEMVRRAREVVPGEVTLVLGGFHLSQATAGQIDVVVASFRELGVNRVAPTHCTGDAAREAFAREYGNDFLDAGVGRLIEVG